MVILKLTLSKITSWNVGTNTYALTSSDGKTARSYILSASGATGKMNILNSEIAYLGRDISGEQGLSYYGGAGSLVQNNNIHHNWRAFYSAGIGGLTFTKNVVHDNLQYGVDPHSGTHDMYITYNKVYNNNHGIICSVMCSNIHIENNEIYNNKRDGIFLDAGSHHSIIANNKIYNEDEGIQLPSLSYSEVYGNTVTNSKYGIVMYTQIGSSFEQDGKCGSIGCVSKNNNIHDNTIKVSGTRIVIKGGASSNIIASNTMSGSAGYGITVEGSTTKGNIFRYNHISNANCGISLRNGNTDSYFKRNYFDTVAPYGEYALSGSSTLRLEDSKFYSDIIKAMDSSSNHISITKSGIITILDGSSTLKYYTDSQTYTKTLASKAIKVNTISPTTLSSTASTLTTKADSASVTNHDAFSESNPNSTITTNPIIPTPQNKSNRIGVSIPVEEQAKALQLKSEKSLSSNKIANSEPLTSNNKRSELYDRTEEQKSRHRTVLTLYAVQDSEGKAAYKLHGKLMDSRTNIPLQGK
jgi:parallel beta-helix repeat protein